MTVYNQRYAYSYLVDRGFAPNAAAGIVGNLIQESGVDPRSNQVGGPGMGIAQWSEGERWQTLLNFAQARGRDPYSLDLQLDFMLHEMKQYGIYNRMQTMNNLEAATKLFMNVFERPDPQYANLDGRIQFAQTLRERDPDVATSANKDRGSGDGKGGKDGKGGDGQDMTKAEYGFTRFFLQKHPEIADLVEKADKQNWTLTRFEAEIKNTDWYRGLTDAQQRWSVLVADKPEQAQKEIDDQALKIEKMASLMGVDLSRSDINDLAKRAARNGLDDAILQDLIGNRYEGGGTQSGQASVTIDQIRNIADDYGVKVDAKTLERWTTQVIAGDQTVEGLIDRMREQAKMLYPTVANLLNTRSTRDLMEPYLNIAADELGIPTDQMRTSDRKWVRALIGEGGPMNADEWTALIRTGQQYGYGDTNKAKGEASSLVTQLAQTFGAKG